MYFRFNETVARELVKHKLQIMGVQKVVWVKDGIEPGDSYTCFH
jgi:hypothetical protein